MHITDDHRQSQLNVFFLFHRAGLLLFGFNRIYNNQHKMASSDGKCSSAKMKPIPQSSEELKKEVQEMALLHLRPNAEPSPRAKLCHFMTASGQIKRSPCYTSILLVGVTGVGKSSTVNHLLNTSGAIKFAKTHDTRSATRDTSEFILTVDEPKFEVSDV